MSQAALTKSLGYKGPGYRTTGAMAPKSRATYKGGMYGPYQAPTSHAFGGTLGANPTNFLPGNSLMGGTTPTNSANTGAPVNPTPITSPASDPRDPTYWTNVGALNFAYNNAVAGLGTRDVAASTKLANSLADFNRQEPIDTQHQRENYNDQGLFYSGHLGEAYGNLVADYARKRTGARDEFASEHADYLSQLDFLSGKLGYDTGTELNNATGRQIDADTTSANNNSLAQLVQALTGGSNMPTKVPTNGTNPVKPTGGTMTAQRNGAPKVVPYTNSQGVKGHLHIYPGGKKVFVRGTGGPMYGGYQAPTSSAFGGQL